jgi:hypothetical protein
MDNDGSTTLGFSGGARLAFKLKDKDYLRNMLSRRQLQGFVRLRAESGPNRFQVLSSPIFAINERRRNKEQDINKPGRPRQQVVKHPVGEGACVVASSHG